MPWSPGTDSGRPGNTQLMVSREPDDEPDSVLILASMSDPRAFAAIFERHSGSVHRYLVKRVGQGPAEDLVGETFATAFRSRSNFDTSRTDARPWLFGIATNTARHYWRAEGRRSSRNRSATMDLPGSPDLSEEVVSTAWFKSQSDVLVTALEQIDEADLDVLLLVAGPGFSYDEVAVALEIPIGTVRSRLARARRQLRELLGESGQYLDEGSLQNPSTIAVEGST